MQYVGLRDITVYCDPVDFDCAYLFVNTLW